MTLVNWPPSKGPKPEHLEVSRGYIFPKVRRSDFKFKQTGEAAAERRAILEAVMEHHGNQAVEEKVGIHIQPKTLGKRDTEFFLDHPVELVASLRLEQADRMIHAVGYRSKELVRALPVRPIIVPITYPLTIGVEVKIRPFVVVETWGDGRREEFESMSIGYLLWAVALEYRRIYADWKHYKPWGHGIEDLRFRTLELRRRSALLGVVS